MQFEQNYCDEICNNIEFQEDPEVENREDLISDIQVPLDRIIAKEGYLKYDTKINTITTEGGNFLGSLYEIDVKGQTKEGSRETNIFVKLMPKDYIFSESISISQCYYNERFAYKEIAKIMNELYDEYVVPESERFKMVKYYTESNEHALIFENLSRKGYSTFDRRHLISLNYAKSVMKELAKFHAISFILKSKRTDFFDQNIRTVKSPVFFDITEATTLDWWEEYLAKMINTSFDYIDVGFKNKKEEMEHIREELVEMMATDSKSRLSSVNCMCHGDVKPGNILWRENKNGESETIFIDYQLLNYSTPIYDISFFIYLSTDRQFRKDHLDYLKNYYHDSMSEFLKYFDLDIDSFYPKHVFERDFKEKIYYGSLIGISFLSFMLHNDPEILMNGHSDRPNAFHSSFKERINEIFQDYIELRKL